MSVARRTWLPLSMLAAGLAGLGMLAWELGGTDSDLATTKGRDAGDAAPPGTVSANSLRGETDQGATKPEIAAKRELDDVHLSSAQRDELRRLEQGGRARFWGVVRAPDGTPCEGATLFVHGEPSMTSDARGRWSVDVEHDVGGAFNRGSMRPSTAIVARKEGVGIASALLKGPSRRVDLVLSAAGGHRLSGLCVDRVSRQRVAGARVEMVFCANTGEPVNLRLATEADERGRFQFTGIPSGTFDLRGFAKDHDTNGWVPLDFSGVRDRDYTLHFEPLIEVRGTFSPWPPPGAADRPGGAPQVVVNTHSPQNSRSQEDPREYAAAVEEDGEFRCRIPNCPRFVARLIVDDGGRWFEQHDPDPVPHDVDFGRIELGIRETSRVRGRVLLPRAFLTFEPAVQLDRSGFLAAKLDDEGCFAIGPVLRERDPWYEFGSLVLGDQWLSLRRQAVTADGDWTPYLREGVDFVAPDLVPADRDEVWFGGRVTDDSGEPVAFAQVRAGMVGVPEEEWRWTETVFTDDHGRFLITNYVDEAGRKRTWEIAVAARGFRQQRFRADSSAFPGFFWCEAKLARGSRLHGTLVDERGAPLVGWRVSFDETEDPNTLLAYDITDGAGEFDCFGVEGDTLQVNLVGPDGQHQTLDRVHVIAGSISLQYSEPNDSIARPSR